MVAENYIWNNHNFSLSVLTPTSNKLNLITVIFQLLWLKNYREFYRLCLGIYRFYWQEFLRIFNNVSDISRWTQLRIISDINDENVCRNPWLKWLITLQYFLIQLIFFLCLSFVWTLILLSVLINWLYLPAFCFFF